MCGDKKTNKHRSALLLPENEKLAGAVRTRSIVLNAWNEAADHLNLVSIMI